MQSSGQNENLDNSSEEINGGDSTLQMYQEEPHMPNLSSDNPHDVYNYGLYEGELISYDVNNRRFIQSGNSRANYGRVVQDTA